MSVIPPDRQTPDQVVEDIAPALKRIWSALEGGAIAAVEYADTQQLPRDPFLISVLVRAHARRALDSQGPVAVDSAHALLREPLSNIGLSLIFRNAYRIKIRKAANGSLRPPGSASAEEYYEQMTLFSDEVETMNLFVIWDVASDASLSLKLVCPRDGSRATSAVSVHWMVELSHPAETIAPAAITEVPDDEVLDLPIELVDEEQL